MLASGLAPSPEALVAARAVQGFGAAMLTPAALSIVTTFDDLDEGLASAEQHLNASEGDALERLGAWSRDGDATIVV
jgi:hypothetical protein